MPTGGLRRSGDSFAHAWAGIGISLNLQALLLRELSEVCYGNSIRDDITIDKLRSLIVTATHLSRLTNKTIADALQTFDSSLTIQNFEIAILL